MVFLFSFVIQVHCYHERYRYEVTIADEEFMVAGSHRVAKGQKNNRMGQRLSVTVTTRVRYFTTVCSIRTMYQRVKIIRASQYLPFTTIYTACFRNQHAR